MEPPTFCVATTHLLFNPKAGDVKLAQLGCLLAELHRMASFPPYSPAATSSSSSPSPAPLLPCLICGDLNSTPLSPLLSFLESSSLDLTQYSAPEVAGYFPGRNRTRPIPIPLFPDCINIGSDCRYTAAKTTPTLTREACDAKDRGKKAGSSPSSPEAVLSHPFSFMSAYPHPSPGHAPSTITTYHSSAFETVDYILFTPLPRWCSNGSSQIKTAPSHNSSRSLHTKNGSSPDNSRSSRVKDWSSRDGGRLPQSGFHLLSRQALPSTHSLRQLGPQPHPLLPSDHLCLLASLQLVWR